MHKYLELRKALIIRYKTKQKKKENKNKKQYMKYYEYINV